MSSAGLVVGGVDPDDTADPAAFRAALDAASFVVALELRETDVTRAADVVFPVAAVADKAGTFVTWEGRPRWFDAVFTNPQALPDSRVLAGIAEELGRPLGFRTVGEVRRADGGPRPLGRRPRHPRRGALRRARRARATAWCSSTWKQLLDHGSMQDGDDNLRATARTPVAKVSQSVFDACGADGHRHRRPRVAHPARPRSPTCPTAWSGSRPTAPATASSPTWPRPAAGSP